MEVERERKDKLAAARKKLNEYKLNRSGGKSPVVTTTTTAPSNPADVPQFYQNLNAPATTFNIFNPAAAMDNNNGVTAASPSSYFSQPSLTPTTVFGPAPVPAPAGVMTDFPIVPNQGFQSHSPNPMVPAQQPAILDPFTTPPPLFSPSGHAGQQLSEERQTTYGLPPQQPTDFIPPPPRTSGLFPSPEVQYDIGQSQLAPVPQGQSQPQGSTTPTPANDNVPLSEGERPYEPGGRNLLDLQEVNLGVSDYFPSAPLPDSRTSPAPPTTNEVIKDHAEAQINNDGASGDHNGIEKTDEAEVGHAAESENADLNSSNIQLFASSLFGSTGTSELDKIFSVGENILTPTPAPVTMGEHSRPESRRSNHEESTPPKNSLFSPTNEITEDLVQPLQIQTVNDITAGIPTEPVFVCGTTFTGESVPLALALAADGITDNNKANDSRNDVSSLDNWSDSSVPLLQTLPAETSPSSVSSSNYQVSPDVLPEVIPSSTTYEETNFNQQIPEEMDVSFERVKTQDIGTDTDDKVSHMKSVQEAMELQIEELRRENEYLLGRQTDLTSKIEESERLAHDFKVDRDRIKEESMTTSQALRARINSLCEENQRIVKNSTEVGVDLRVMMEEKTKQLEEMQKAVIVVSQSKMDFAARLDNELERVKELQNTVSAKDEEINALRGANAELQEKLKQEQQKDAVIHQLQDQARHYQVQSETLHKELFIIRKKSREQGTEKTQQGAELSPTSESSHSHHHHHQDQHEGPHNHDQCSSPEKSDEVLTHSSSSHLHAYDQGSNVQDDHHHQHSGTSEHDHSHAHDHHHEHSDHDHDHNDHHHDHNDHHHDHNDHHHDHNDHHHLDENVEVVARRGPTDEFTELKKTLHRLQWENSTYRTELDILAVDAKQKHTYEEKCTTLEEENGRLRKEVEQLEHVIIQLQGENDTIGDYISLYQTQKMALKESAKEKDAQLELLAREREMLLHRLAELTSLVKDLRESKSEAGSTCADDHIHEFPSVPSSNNKRQIEGKIRDLLTEIGSSTLIENFHPCALCSGRLMTV